MTSAAQRQPAADPILRLDRIAAGAVSNDPYPHLLASGVLPDSMKPALKADFPEIKKPGFFPLSLLKTHGAFEQLITELQGPELASILSDKLGLELRDKPRMITIRKWSAIGDGRIHNDGEAKIATSLLYLNESWGEDVDGGRLRVLRSEDSFDSTVLKISPEYGSFFAFKRTENSWHGHKPFAGERRVVQITWLRSWDDYHRKEKRGKLSFLLKKFRRDAY